MQALIIPADDNTPAVTLNAEEQIFLIEGESYPESASKFYAPVIEWLKKYETVLQAQKKIFEKNRRMTFQFKFDYFNSSSAKYIYEIFSVLDRMAVNGLQVRAKWFYQKEDTDMIESGKELAKMVFKLPVRFVEIESVIESKQ